MGRSLMALELIEATVVPAGVSTSPSPQSIIHHHGRRDIARPRRRRSCRSRWRWTGCVAGASQRHFTQARLAFEPLDGLPSAVALARDVATRRGTFPAVYNAANEEAAAAFLAGRIRFPQIVDTVAEVLAGAGQFAGVPSTVDDILTVESEARVRANAIVDKLETS